MGRLPGLLAAVTFILSTSVRAAPVQRTVDATLSLSIPGLDSIEATGTGTVTVDTATGTLAIPAGLVSLTAKVVIPLTATTAIASLSATVISNQSGTLSLGGATSQVPGEVCPLGLPACVEGGQVGGHMGLEGGVNVVVIPGALVIPLGLNELRIGQGGYTNTPFPVDAAPWTNGTGVVQTLNGTVPVYGTGTIDGTRISFVTPTRILALGNLLPIYSRLRLSFAPEPGALALAAAGLAAIVVLVRARRPRD